MRLLPFFRKYLSAIFIGVTALLASSCGSQDPASGYTPSNGTQLGSSITPTTTLPICGKSCCQTEMKNSDYDGDGVSDFEEVYGRSIEYLGQSVTVYTDPTLVSTNNVRRDIDIASNLIDNTFLTLPVAINRSPVYRDFVLRVYAKGGHDNQPDTSTSKTSGGWNSYSFVQWLPGDSVYIQDLSGYSGLNQTTSGEFGFTFRGLQSPSFPSTGFPGHGKPNNLKVSLHDFFPVHADERCQNNECIASEAWGSLIGKWAAQSSTAVPYPIGTSPFPIGSRMTAGNLVTTALAVPPDFTGGETYLMLRENDFSTTTGRDSGYVTVLVSLQNSAAYSQVPPTGAREIQLLTSLCTSAKYPSQVLNLDLP